VGTGDAAPDACCVLSSEGVDEGFQCPVETKAVFPILPSVTTQKTAIFIVTNVRISSHIRMVI
jgi:hypothetical protein